MRKRLLTFLFLVLPAPLFAGAFFVNFLVLGTTGDQAAQVVQKLGLTAFLLQEKDTPDQVLICEKISDEQNSDYGVDLGKKISQALHRVVFYTLVHDSDVLYQVVLSDGVPVFTFDSWPGYFEGRDRKPHLTGLKALARLLQRNPQEIQSLYTADYTFAEDLLAKIAGPFHFPKALAWGYTYVSQEKAELLKEEVQVREVVPAP